MIDRRVTAFALMCVASTALAGGRDVSREHIFAAGIHVSPAGSDTNPGTTAEPFATLERARDAVRALKAAGGRGPTTIWLHEGTYVRTQPFTLTASDSGTETAPITYRSMPGARVVISGGIPLTKTVACPRGMTARIRCYSLSANGVPDASSLRQKFSIHLDPPGPMLYHDAAVMPLASWPNDGWARIANTPTGRFTGVIEYEGDNPARWTRIEDIILHGYWAYDWADSFETIRSIDTEKRWIETNYVRPPHAYGFVPGQRWRALNVLEELDTPGEWYLDRRDGIVYFYPPSDRAGDPVLTVSDRPLIAMQDTAWITIRGLILEYGRSSGVEISGGHDNRVAGCVLRNFGTVAVAIGTAEPMLRYKVGVEDPSYRGDAGVRNGVVSCRIYNTGKGGVLLGGGDRLTLVPGRNYVTNTELHDYSKLQQTGAAAVFMYGVGNRVTHNKIYNAPQTAIFFWGNDHLIEYNDVSRVCLEVADAGAMNFGRDFTQRGTVIRYNYIHDIPGEDGGHIGVYLDDFSSGTTVHGNVFARVSFGVNIGGGRDNVISNNVFDSCTRAVRLDARGTSWAKKFFTGDDDTLFARMRLVGFDRPPYSTRYPSLARILANDPALPTGNEITRNIIVGGGMGLTFDDGAERYVDITRNFQGDAKFVAPERGDYTLSDDSPAADLGYEPIPFSRIGLYEDEFYLGLPRD